MKYIVLILAFVSFSLTGSDKFVIGHHGCGFFSCFLGAINNIMWCEKNNKIPVIHWDAHSLYYDERDPECKENAWLCFFKPVSQYKYSLGDYIHNNYYNFNEKSSIAIPPCVHERIEINKVIRRWIQLNDTIQETVNNFYNTHIHGKKTVGIHIRRTDKYTERPDVPLEKIFSTANNIDTEQYFVATDEMEILEAAQKALCKPVIFFPCQRSTDGTPVHYNSQRVNKTQSGRDVLIEAVLLTRTDLFIHTLSNVSCAVLYLNPDLKNIEMY